MVLGKIKNVLTVVSIIIAILASGYGLFSKVRADRMQAQRDNAIDELHVKTTEVVTYQNELGQTVTKTLEYARYLDDLRFSNDSLERKIYTTIEASQLKQRQLKEAYAVNMKTTGGGFFAQIMQVPVIVPGDTTSVIDSMQVKYFSDGYLNAIVYADSLTYTYDDTIILIKAARMEDRKFFLWKWIGWKKKIDRDMVEIVANNHNSKINGRMIKLGE